MALSREEFQALAELAKARRMAMQNMFNGTKLVFGTMDRLKAGKKIAKGGKKVKSNVEKLVKGGPSESTRFVPAQVRAQAEEFITTCADVDGIEDVVAAITGDALNELIGEITPFIGIARSGMKSIKAAKAVAQDGKALYKSKSYKQGFRPGDPQAAADAVITIIKRDLAKDSINLARHSAATGTKIAGLFADLGTATTAAVGTANAVAALGLELYQLGTEIKEMKAGNKRLQSPATLNLEVFSECPILGCYMLTCADTSTVANFFIADIGLPGWMDKVEQMKKKQMDPMLKLAKKDIKNSRLQLEGLASDKGTHNKKGFFAKKKSQALKNIGMG